MHSDSPTKVLSLNWMNELAHCVLAHVISSRMGVWGSYTDIILTSKHCKSCISQLEIVKNALIMGTILYWADNKRHFHQVNQCFLQDHSDLWAGGDWHKWPSRRCQQRQSVSFFQPRNHYQSRWRFNFIAKKAQKTKQSSNISLNTYLKRWSGVFPCQSCRKVPAFQPSIEKILLRRYFSNKHRLVKRSFLFPMRPFLIG